MRLLRHWEQLTISSGVLYHTSKDAVTKRKTYRYVVLSKLKDKVLKGIHDEAGHQGQRRTLYLARQRFYWTGMEKDVRDYVQHCQPCLISKSPEPAARAPLESVKSTRPLELVCIDFWSAEDSSNKSLDVLVSVVSFLPPLIHKTSETTRADGTDLDVNYSIITFSRLTLNHFLCPDEKCHVFNPKLEYPHIINTHTHTHTHN